MVLHLKINNAHVPGSSKHFSPLSVEIKQLLLYQSKRTYTCKTTCNHIDRSTGPIFVHDTRVLFRVDLTYQIKFYKIHVISMFKLSLFFCDSLVFFERKQFCVFFIFVCLYLQCCWRSNHQEGEFGLINRIVSAIFVCTSQAMIFNWIFPFHSKWRWNFSCESWTLCKHLFVVTNKSQ